MALAHRGERFQTGLQTALRKVGPVNDVHAELHCAAPGDCLARVSGDNGCCGHLAAEPVAKDSQLIHGFGLHGTGLA